MSVNELDEAGLTLPATAGPLIGRAAEVALIHHLLTNGTVPLLTLCGVGGIGKIRLALEVARIAESEFAHSLGAFVGGCTFEAAAARQPRQREWLVRLDREHANTLLALRWFVDHGDVERSFRLTVALAAFWWARGFTAARFERGA